MLPIKVQKIWKNLSGILKDQIRTCKICFKNIEKASFFFLGKREICICDECADKFVPKYIEFNVKTYNALSIYVYDETIKTYLYQLKGCYDIEIYQCFLERYCRELRLLYRNYIVIPVPSSEDDDKIRGFNHVEMIFSILKLPIYKVLHKNGNYKQADHDAEGRKRIKQYLTIDKIPQLKGKKILIVDDVYTTGSTMRACVELVESLCPKQIKILVLSKTKSPRKDS